MAAQRGDACRLETRRSATDHEHVTPFRRGLDRPLELVAGLRIDGTADTLVDEDLADTDVAVDARPDQFAAPFRELARQVRIGEQLAAQQDEVIAATSDVFIRDLGLDAPGGQDGHADGLPDRSRVTDQRAGLVNQRRLGECDSIGERRVGGNADGLRAGLLGKPGSRDGVGDRDAALGAQFLAIQPDPDRVVRADATLHGRDRLEQQPGTVLERAAVFVLALVVIRREEPCEDVGVRGMHLHPVESRRLRARGRCGKPLDHLLDVALVHHAQLGLALAHPADEVRQFLVREGAHHRGLQERRRRGYPHRASLGEIARGSLARMLQLDGYAGAVPVRALGDPREAGDEIVP